MCIGTCTYDQQYHQQQRLKVEEGGLVILSALDVATMFSFLQSHHFQWLSESMSGNSFFSKLLRWFWKLMMCLVRRGVDIARLN